MYYLTPEPSDPQKTIVMLWFKEQTANLAMWLYRNTWPYAIDWKGASEGGIRRAPASFPLTCASFLPPSAQDPFWNVGLVTYKSDKLAQRMYLQQRSGGGGEFRVTAVGFMTIQFWFLYLSKRIEKQEKNKGFWYFVEDFCFCGSSRILVCNFFLLFFWSVSFLSSLNFTVPFLLLVLDSFCLFSPWVVKLGFFYILV